MVCVESFWFSASDVAVELLLWLTSPDEPPPQQLLLSVVTGAFTFDCTPGMDVADEFAFWSMSFLAFCFCLLRCVWFGSPDAPLQQLEPSCSAACCCPEVWSWWIACVESLWFSALEFAAYL